MSATAPDRGPHPVYDQEPSFFAGFDQWKAAVDEVIADVCGMISDDLPDVDYIGLHETGNTPHQAARHALKEADAPAELWADLPE